MARVAIVLARDFEDSEFRVPYDRLKLAGHDVAIVGAESGELLAGKKGIERITTDRSAKEVTADDFDALVIPGGYSPDKLRVNEKIVRLTREIFEAGKPVAAVCHGPSLLVEADVVDGRTLTSWPSIRTDVVNAGARWVDEEVVQDDHLITSRKPEDLPAFCDAILKQLEVVDAGNGGQTIERDARIGGSS